MRGPVDWGEIAPNQLYDSGGTERFNLNPVAGNYLVLALLDSVAASGAEAFLKALIQGGAADALAREDVNLRLVSRDPVDKGVRPEGLDALGVERGVAIDPGGLFAAAYRLESGAGMTPRWYLLDPSFRVYATGGLDEAARLCDSLAGLPASRDHVAQGFDGFAPVLIAPRILEPDFCQTLIDYYKAGSPRESGFMRQEGDKTVERRNPAVKRRKDVLIEDAALRRAYVQKIGARLNPLINKAFQFKVECIERYVIAGYSDEDQGFFLRHRDNTTPGTRHRRFAVSINLNANDYEGGDLSFPEFGERRYRAPTGGAVVFSCDLLHEVDPVTKGTRYATLPFLFSEADRVHRQASRGKVVNVAG